MLSLLENVMMNLRRFLVKNIEDKTNSEHRNQLPFVVLLLTVIRQLQTTFLAKGGLATSIIKKFNMVVLPKLSYLRIHSILCFMYIPF